MRKLSPELEIVLDNDREWRKYILEEMQDIQDDQKKMLIEMTTLKVKVALFSGVISTVISFIVGKL
jgi:hypothetical protein